MVKNTLEFTFNLVTRCHSQHTPMLTGYPILMITSLLLHLILYLLATLLCGDPRKKKQLMRALSLSLNIKLLLMLQLKLFDYNNFLVKLTYVYPLHQLYGVIILVSVR